MATVIIINGQPGVGKSSLLKRLSTDLGIGYLAKDSIKELLGDTLYVEGETIEPFYYGDASIKAFFAVVNSFISTNKTMFIENAFWYDIAKSRIEELVEGTDTKLVQVYVTCDYDEAVRRFNQRSAAGERHSIHPDTVYSERDVETNRQKYRALDVEGMETYTIDTTNMTEDDYQELITWLKAEIGGDV